MTATPQTTTIDVRTIVPRNRHPEYGGEFKWEYLESGADVWRVRIDRVAACCA